MKKSFKNKKKAFTLVELLVVIAIIGILFIVLVSKVDFATDKAKAIGVQTVSKSARLMSPVSQPTLLNPPSSFATVERDI